MKSVKILLISFIVIGIKTSYAVDVRQHTSDLCCSSTNATDCIHCSANVTFCCTNQPYTYQNYGSPFCCDYGEECCGNSQCCKGNQVCCIGWKNSEGVCCDSDSCSSDGECNSNSRPSRSMWYIIGGVGFAVVLLFCIYISCKIRRATSNRHQARRLGYRLAQTESDEQPELIIAPSFLQPSLNDDMMVPAQFIGLPMAVLNQFPTMSWQDDSNGTKKPEKSENIEEYSEYMCSICLDSYAKDEKLRLLPCAHVYHAGCIDLWFKKNTTCPLCNQDFSAYQYQ